MHYQKLYTMKNIFAFGFVLGVLLSILYNKLNRIPSLKKSAKPLSPVIFVPGNVASQIEAKIDKPETVHYFCHKTSDWFTIWLSFQLLIPFAIDCWVDNLSLIYDNETRTTRNSPGVETRVRGWGDPESVEWLDPRKYNHARLFKDVGDALVAEGYVRNVSIRGAPYDFRKAPNENQQWFLDLKKLVEETYEANNKVPVTFIVHSMGAQMTLTFLQQQNKIWKSKYVSRIISLGGSWGGSVIAFKAYTIGDNLSTFFIRESPMKKQQITMPSLAFVMPSLVLWKPDEVLVQTQSRTYSLSQLEEFFIDLNYTNGWEMRKDTLKYTDFTAPGVEIHSLYGCKVPTVEKLNYTSNDLSGYPTLINGDGDGVINIRSLEGCSHWIGKEEQLGKNISTVGFPGVGHREILRDNRVLQYILELLLS